MTHGKDRTMAERIGLIGIGMMGHGIAKNLATKAMVASLLGDTPSILRDVPDISDVKVVRSLLEVHGVRV